MAKLGITLCGLLTLWSASTFAQAINSTLHHTFTNPVAEQDDGFAWFIVPGVSNEVFIGAPGVNKVYLFHANGTLLQTFTGPTLSRSFGHSIAPLGPNHVLIGDPVNDSAAQYAGAAFLFHRDGTLLKTYLPPILTFRNKFGSFVTAVGTNKVLITEPEASTSNFHSGVAHLFTLDGTLLTTITNPLRSTIARFGVAGAAIGDDRVLITAPQATRVRPGEGEAYLYDTNGTLLTTFSNPTHGISTWFGSSAAAVGTSHVIIGAPLESAADHFGVAYLFSTNGTLVTTITNPAPTGRDQFGSSVAAVGTDRLIIGAISKDGIGAAYLYGTNGTLLGTFTNPEPALGTGFGLSVSPFGDNGLIFSTLSRTSELDGSGYGKVYYYTFEEDPFLNITRSGSDFSITWTGPEDTLVLQESSVLGSSAQWIDSDAPISINGKTVSIEPSIPLQPTNRFYRLIKK